MAKLTSKNIYDFLRTKNISISENGLKALKHNRLNKKIKMFYINNQQFRSDAQLANISVDILKIELITNFNEYTEFTLDWQDYLISLDVDFANMIIQKAEEDYKLDELTLFTLNEESKNYKQDAEYLKSEMKALNNFKQNAIKNINNQKI